MLFILILQTFLVGTKYDLKDDESTLAKMKLESPKNPTPISKAEGEAMAKKIKAIRYFETSAKPPTFGISELFEAIIEGLNQQDEPTKCCQCSLL